MTILVLPSDKRGKGLRSCEGRAAWILLSISSRALGSFLQPIIKNKVRRMKRSTKFSSNATISDTGCRRCLRDMQPARPCRLQNVKGGAARYGRQDGHPTQQPVLPKAGRMRES